MKTYFVIIDVLAEPNQAYNPAYGQTYGQPQPTNVVVISQPGVPRGTGTCPYCGVSLKICLLYLDNIWFGFRLVFSHTRA